MIFLNAFIAEVAQSILAGGSGADYSTAAKLAQTGSGDNVYDLLYWANRIRLAKIGPKIRLCAIAAGKIGFCPEDCAFCGQSVHHRTPLPDARAAMSAVEIVTAAHKALE